MSSLPEKERRRMVQILLQRAELERGLGVDRLPRAPRRRPLSKGEMLSRLRERIGDCNLCGLGRSRTNLVFGVGDPNASLMFVGEAPGAEEDLQGEPFVGPAGQLLTRIIEAIGLRREQVYIANVLKCRPPNNRTPAPDEMAKCLPFLREQIGIVQPKIIVALGSVAARALLETDEPIGHLRGRFHEVQGIRVMPTYHPAYLLRYPEQKRPVWEDMKKVRDALRESAT